MTILGRTQVFLSSLTALTSLVGKAQILDCCIQVVLVISKYIGLCTVEVPENSLTCKREFQKFSEWRRLKKGREGGDGNYIAQNTIAIRSASIVLIISCAVASRLTIYHKFICKVTFIMYISEREGLTLIIHQSVDRREVRTMLDISYTITLTNAHNITPCAKCHKTLHKMWQRSKPSNNTKFLNYLSLSVAIIARKLEYVTSHMTIKYITAIG